MHAFLETINEWGYALGEVLQGQLEAGSMSALAVVFVAGLLTSFTPCVYPMIPVTVSYIGGAAAGSRRRAVSLSLIYVLGMALIYAALGVVNVNFPDTRRSENHVSWEPGQGDAGEPSQERVEEMVRRPEDRVSARQDGDLAAVLPRNPCS